MSPQNFVTSENFRPFVYGGKKKGRFGYDISLPVGFAETRKQLIHSGDKIPFPKMCLFKFPGILNEAILERIEAELDKKKTYIKLKMSKQESLYISIFTI